jgi:hypothetical protein
MRTSILRIAFACLLAIVAIGCSEDNSVGPGGSSAITGRVIDALTNAPLAGASISTTPATQSVVTDTGGNFTIANVAAGTYAINASRAGYANATLPVTMTGSQNLNVVIPMVAGSGGDSLKAPFNPIPQDGAAGQPTYITLQWSASGEGADVLQYDVYFGDNPAPPIVDSDLDQRSLLRSGLETDKTYYWRVVVKNQHGQQVSSPVWSFKTTNLQNNNPPAIPSDPAPVNGASSQPYTLTLRWKCSDPDGDPLKYDVYFGTNPTPSELIVSDQSGTSYQVTKLQESMTYYWRVVAKDNHNGITSSPVWSFSGKTNLAPTAPYGPTPVNGAIDQSIALTMRWNASDDDGDPLTYDVYLGTNNPPTDIVVADRSSNNYTPSLLSGETTYFWRVVAKDGHGGTTSGPVWSFTTKSGPKSGLVAFYPFNSNANDESGNGHHGTVYGATLTTDRHGQPNSAYHFAKSNGQYIQVPHSQDLNLNGVGITVGAWVRFTGTLTHYTGILGKGPDGGADPGYIIVVMNQNKLGTAIGEPGWIEMNGNRAINDGQWHYITVVMNASKLTKLYVDGVLDATGQAASSVSIDFENTRPLFIGTERNKDLFFNGDIDEVRIYDYALTDSEIQALAAE